MSTAITIVRFGGFHWLKLVATLAKIKIIQDYHLAKIKIIKDYHLAKIKIIKDYHLAKIKIIT